MLTTLALALSLLSGAHADTTTTARLDALDRFIETQLERRKVPGLSLAIIDSGRIVYARGYGVTRPGGTEPVTTQTLFLAGSVSKSVAAMGALRLVEQGKLTMDGDVNDLLRTWKVPENDHTRVEKVTVRRIVSHTAGLTVHGFAGYARTASVPTVPQILDGASPANSAPVRVDTVPGTRWRYSGGGYTVMQLLMEDVTATPFATWMQQHVLQPLGMTSSTFENPLPPSLTARAAAGVYGNRSPVEGDWHVYPEMAAAGLWTTASDLARFAIGVQASFAGTSNPVISRDMTRQMLSCERNDFDGLGVFLEGNGPTLLFSHGGRDEGFDTYMGAYASTGRGVVIMINANDNSGLLRRIRNVVARQYGWPNPEPLFQAKPVRIPGATLASFAGRYEAANNDMLTLMMQDGRLVSLADGLPDRVWIPTGPLTITSDDGERQFTFEKGPSGIVGFSRVVDGRARTAPRIGPLLAGRQPATDPNPARTAAVDSALRALAAGGPALEGATGIVAGTKSSLGSEPVRALAGYSGITYLLEEDVRGRGIERHGSAIVRVLHYRLNSPARDPFVLVHLSDTGQLADYDVVPK